jgi:hypothetical protein
MDWQPRKIHLQIAVRIVYIIGASIYWICHFDGFIGGMCNTENMCQIFWFKCDFLFKGTLNRPIINVLGTISQKFRENWFPSVFSPQQNWTFSSRNEVLGLFNFPLQLVLFCLRNVICESERTIFCQSVRVPGPTMNYLDSQPESQAG